LLNVVFNFQHSFVFTFADMKIISPFFIFPNIGWWAKILNADIIVLDAGEHFEKMTYRNRYRISGANNSILLSVPLARGRNQHVQMKDVRIHNEEDWQTRHWRTLVSVYNRAPYFDHYENSLKPLFETQFDYLTEFNMAALQWVKQQLKLKFEIEQTDVYLKEYPAEITDLRKIKYPLEPFPKYYQVFEDRIGFQPDLSILDILFCEGPGAGEMLIS
jgi:hypothetical protein